MKRSSREIVESLSQVRATRFRQELGNGSAPITNVVQLLEDQGALVVRQRTSQTLSGVFFRTKSATMVLINSAKSFGHQQFTAAHELHHHLYDKGLNYSLNDADWSEHEFAEGYANAFAAELLMPQMAVAKDWWDMGLNARPTTPEDVIHLNHKWHVSYGAMCLRLLKIGKLHQDDYRDLLSAPARQLTLRLGYGTSLVDPTGDVYVSSKYLRTAVDAYDSGFISEGKLREVLALVGREPPDVGFETL